METDGHTFAEDAVSVLHKDSDWFRRGVAESIHIAIERPSLNRDRGRHSLPVIYREILVSRGGRLATESRDQATLF